MIFHEAFFEYFHIRIGIWGPIALLPVIIIIRVNTSRCPGQVNNCLTECPKLQKRQYFMTYIPVQRQLRRISHDAYLRPEDVDMEYWWASKKTFLKCRETQMVIQINTQVLKTAYVIYNLMYLNKLLWFITMDGTTIITLP